MLLEPRDPRVSPSMLDAAAAPPELLAAALMARDHAHAPYSNFRVGAALRTGGGQVISGANVENASYGLSLCAERSALVSAVSQGVRAGEVAELLVVGDTPGPISPCGACRQVMLELGGPQLRVWMANLQGRVRVATAAELLPGGFAAEDLDPTRRGPAARPESGCVNSDPS